MSASGGVVVTSIVAVLSSVAGAQQLELGDFTIADSGNIRIMAGDHAARDREGLQLSANARGRAGVRLAPRDGIAWDLFDYTRLVLDVENLGDAPAHFRVRAENPEAVDWARSAIGDGYIGPKTRKSFNVYFYRPGSDRDRFPELAVFRGMKGFPGGFQTHWHTIDASDVRAIDISASSEASPLRLSLRSIKAANPVVPTILREKGEAFFPFVDRYGQYHWEDWIGKVKSDAELVAGAKTEAEDLQAHPRPGSWDEWGGWREGPSLPPANFFRVEKVDGRWWFVDPAGRLFWSHGANCVGYGSAVTRVKGRENYFADLPSASGEFAFAWSDDGQSFDHLAANLRRTFGDAMAVTTGPLAQDRMASWGLNTIGAWSDGNVVALRRTPYTAIVHPHVAEVAEKIPDVFDPTYVETVKAGVQKELGDAAGDPWCIGVFVDNELSWGADALDFMADVLAAPPSKFTKRVLVERLQSSLGTIEAFNAVAGTTHADWDALLASRTALRPRALAPLREPLSAFYAEVADRYFKTAKAAVHDAAPGQLYMGCRFHVQSRPLVDVASRYCDVLSFNRYEHSVEAFDGYGTDRPILVTEFHFGALDAGMLGTGLKSATDRYDRATKYQAYVEGARRNPRIVGTHWFAFCPQSITGRGDGENYNTGLFDICNQPLPEMREALRTAEQSIYR